MNDSDPAVPAEPENPLHALTVTELQKYRQQLESAVRFFGRKNPPPPARADCQVQLDAVLAEQDERARGRQAPPGVNA